MHRTDVQGLVFRGYSGLPVSQVLLLRFGQGDARSWLRRIVPRIASASERIPGPCCFNLALTTSGLLHLGLSEEVVAEFSPEFRQGMAARAPVLGDVGEDAPGQWEFGAEAGDVDAVLFVYCRTPGELSRELDQLLALLARFELSVRNIETFLPADGREHFGFRMGLSEPGLTRAERRRGRERVPLGEFLLGHRNAYGERTPTPKAPLLRSTRALPPVALGSQRLDFGLNGSYVVLRKLEQRTALFSEFLRARAEHEGEARANLLGARMIGRWPSGAPLALYPNEPPLGTAFAEHAFGYADDLSGARCPLGAHVRRAHPREALGRGDRAHRILRRGRLYGQKLPDSANGQDDGNERGLLFVALNADLGRQFETIQGSFLNGPCLHGFPSENDPLIGRDLGTDSTHTERHFSEPGNPVRRVVSGLPRFVRLRGGAYAFLPSLTALNYLAELRR